LWPVRLYGFHDRYRRLIDRTLRTPLLKLAALPTPKLTATPTSASRAPAAGAMAFVPGAELVSAPPQPSAAPAQGQTAVLPHALHLVRTLEQDVIPRLAQAHRAAAAAEAVEAVLAAPTAHDVEVFAARVIDGSEAGILSMVERLRRRGATAEMIYTDLLAPVARHLGSLWETDLCDFATVTVGVARLQRLMRELSPSFGAGAPLSQAAHAYTHGQGHGQSDTSTPAYGTAQARSILLTQAPDEQHSLGLSMVAEFFRRDGWLVNGGVGPYGGDPAMRAHAEWFDVVGFSLGGEARLPWLREKIAAVRLASRNAGVVVMVGGPLFNANPGWVDHVGADAWAQDAREAPGLAAQHVKLAAERG
jgi:MerR family transcriptional regulator, light-induced transcriptional regulator